jgi:hypothetical protein
MLCIIDRCKIDRGLSANDLRKAAWLCQRPRKSFPVAAKAALSAALQKMLSSNTPSYDTLAQVHCMLRFTGFPLTCKLPHDEMCEFNLFTSETK